MAQIDIGRKTGLPQGPVEAIGYAIIVFKPVIAGKPVQREKIAILKVDSPRIFVWNLQIANGRRCHDLNAWRENLRTAKGLSYERPLNVCRRCKYAARLPAGFTAVNCRKRACIIVAVVDIATRKHSKVHFLTKAINCPQVPLGRGKSPLCVLSLRAGNG